MVVVVVVVVVGWRRRQEQQQHGVLYAFVSRAWVLQLPLTSLPMAVVGCCADATGCSGLLFLLAGSLIAWLSWRLHSRRHPPNGFGLSVSIASVLNTTSTVLLAPRGSCRGRCVESRESTSPQVDSSLSLTAAAAAAAAVLSDEGLDPFMRRAKPSPRRPPSLPPVRSVGCLAAPLAERTPQHRPTDQANNRSPYHSYYHNYCRLLLYFCQATAIGEGQQHTNTAQWLIGVGQCNPGDPD